MRVNGNKAPDELPDIRTATTGDYIVTSPAHMSLAEGRGRLWRSLKYEEVYLKAYATVAQARAEVGNSPITMANASPGVGLSASAAIFSANLAYPHEEQRKDDSFDQKDLLSR